MRFKERCVSEFDEGRVTFIAVATPDGAMRMGCRLPEVGRSGMKRLKTQWLIGLFLVFVNVSQDSRAAPPFQAQEDHPDAQQPSPAAKSQSVREGMGSVGEIALKLKAIEKHLQSMEKSIIGIDLSVRPVGAELQAIDVRLQSLDKSVAGIDTSVKPVVVQLKVIEERVQGLEKSIAGINESLKPLGEVMQPKGISALTREIFDLAYAQARALVWLATGCGAGLIAFSAALRRWNRRRTPRQG